VTNGSKKEKKGNEEKSQKSKEKIILLH